MALDVAEGGCCIAAVAFDGASCFVATATLGPRHPDLDDLRRFRDHVLARSAPGRLFIGNKPVLKAVVREALVRPLARLARRLAP